MIYLILGILYEDFIHHLTILSGLPSAGFGALLTLLIFQVELNLYSFIGIILLVGIVKKNGIMLVDFAIERQQNPTRSHSRSLYCPISSPHNAVFYTYTEAWREKMHQQNHAKFPSQNHPQKSIFYLGFLNLRNKMKQNPSNSSILTTGKVSTPKQRSKNDPH